MRRNDGRPTRDNTAMLPSLPAWQATDEAWRIGLRLLSEVADAAKAATERWPIPGYAPDDRLAAVRGYLPAPLREKVDSQARKWALACQSGGLDALRHEHPRMLKAWAAIGASLACVVPNPLTWRWSLSDGTPLVLVQSDADLSLVSPPPGAQVWSLPEVARLIEGMPGDVLALKAKFRAAILTSLRENARHGGEPDAPAVPFRDDDLDQVNWMSDPGFRPPGR